jgi:hypothetical protein
MKMEDLRRKINRPIQKELLSSHLYTKWVDELEVVEPSLLYSFDYLFAYAIIY